MTFAKLYRSSAMARLAYMASTFALLTALAQAQTITVLHNFTGRDTGAYPYAGLTIDGTGTFYGTTYAGGYSGDGEVFRLAAAGTGWIVTPLYSFHGEPDGKEPWAGVIVGPDGSLYGTTFEGGQNDGGTVYRLRPSPTTCGSFVCPWQETILYSFCSQSHCTDGAGPSFANLIFDQAGNIYGTTSSGGDGDEGVVFKLTLSGGAWTESVLYSFPSSCDTGCIGSGSVVFDSAGNLYGTTLQGGENNTGVVFELSPSGSGWTEQVLVSVPIIVPDNITYGGLAIDGEGNLYGTTGGPFPGEAFQVARSGRGWVYNVMQTFTSSGGGGGPWDTPTLDASGNVYGTSSGTGLNSLGEVFKLTPSNGGWIYTSYPFTSSTGYSPIGGVVLDAAGNMYGTNLEGGSLGYGTIWKITP